MEDYRKADGRTDRCMKHGHGRYWMRVDYHRGVTEHQVHLLRKRSNMDMKWVNVAIQGERKGE